MTTRNRPGWRSLGVHDMATQGPPWWMSGLRRATGDEAVVWTPERSLIDCLKDSSSSLRPSVRHTCTTHRESVSARNGSLRESLAARGGSKLRFTALSPK
jgi:hypothetical protein